MLESLRTARLNALVTLVQKNVRRRIAYKNYQDLRRRTIVIQAWWRGILGRRFAEQMRKEAAATLIQRVARTFLQRRSYLQTRQAVVDMQSGVYMTIPIIADILQWPADISLGSVSRRLVQCLPPSLFRVCSVACKCVEPDSMLTR